MSEMRELKDIVEQGLKGMRAEIREFKQEMKEGVLETVGSLVHSMQIMQSSITNVAKRARGGQSQAR